MPGVDGFELCRRLKADPETRLTPVVLITGSYGAGDDKVRGIEGGRRRLPLEALRPGRAPGPGAVPHPGQGLYGRARAGRSGIVHDGPHNRGEGPLYGRALREALGIRQCPGREARAPRRGGERRPAGRRRARSGEDRRPRQDSSEGRPPHSGGARGHRAPSGHRGADMRVPQVVQPDPTHHPTSPREAGRIGLPRRAPWRRDPDDGQDSPGGRCLRRLTTERPYKAALPFDVALEELAREVEKGWWDRQVFEEFRRFVREGLPDVA